MPESIRSLVSRTMAGYKLGGYAEATISSALMEREKALADSAINLADSRYVEGDMFREIFDQVGMRYTEPGSEAKKEPEADESAQFIGPAADIIVLLRSHGVKTSRVNIDSAGEITLVGTLGHEPYPQYTEADAEAHMGTDQPEDVKVEPDWAANLHKRLDHLGQRVSAIEGRLDNPTLSL